MYCEKSFSATYFEIQVKFTIQTKTEGINVENVQGFFEIEQFLRMK